MGLFDVPPIADKPLPTQDPADGCVDEASSQVVQPTRSDWQIWVRPEFDGSTWEYLQIWLPHRILSVLTLGLYAPWAALRLKRYLWRHTAIAGRRFDIDFEPRRLFVGRLVLLLVLFGSWGLSSVVPKLLTYLPIIVFALLPYVLTRSYAMRWRWLSLNGVRFDGEPDARPLLWPLLLAGVVTVLYSLGVEAWIMPGKAGWREAWMLISTSLLVFWAVYPYAMAHAFRARFAQARWSGGGH